MHSTTYTVLHTSLRPVRCFQSGIRILDGAVTDELEARALLYNNDYVDIYSASWGPHDDGATMEGPKRACTEALKRGVKNVSITVCQVRINRNVGKKKFNGKDLFIDMPDASLTK